MCFWKSEESKVLVAKRDITVYKLGCFASSNLFYPIYRTAYCYYKNKIVKEDVTFNDGMLTKGFHSYISCIIKPYKKNCDAIPYLLHAVSANNLHLNILFCKNDNVFLAKFIIPKGAVYCVNRGNEVISNSIVYTGNYIKLEGTMNFNVKDIWKEKQEKYLLIKIKHTK